MRSDERRKRGRVCVKCEEKKRKVANLSGAEATKTTRPTWKQSIMASKDRLPLHWQIERNWPSVEHLPTSSRTRRGSPFTADGTASGRLPSATALRAASYSIALSKEPSKWT